MPARHVRSKWDKTGILLNTSLKRYIPETAVYDMNRLDNMLNKYGMVYVKPNVGTHGNGVMRVKRQKDASYEWREGVISQSFPSIQQLHAHLLSRTGKHKYLIQQGIDLLTHQDRIFDLRILVQRNPKNNWEVMYIFGRKAAPNKVVTNTNNGGTITSFSILMKSHLTNTSTRKLEQLLQQIGLNVAKELSAHYSGLKELGLDIALDKSLHPWILEVNTKPAINVYRAFDPTAYRRILRYAKAYGRNK